MEDTMNEVVTLGVPCSPAISTKLECLGWRKEIIINENGGGINGNRVILYGETSTLKGTVSIYLSESNRNIRANPSFISRTEPVKLWKQTHKHDNSNFPDKIQIRYYISYGDVELEQSDSIKTYPKHPMIENIKKDVC